MCIINLNLTAIHIEVSVSLLKLKARTLDKRKILKLGVYSTAIYRKVVEISRRIKNLHICKVDTATFAFLRITKQVELDARSTQQADIQTELSLSLTIYELVGNLLNSKGTTFCFTDNELTTLSLSIIENEILIQERSKRRDTSISTLYIE